MVNIYKQELTILQQEILRLLFKKAGKQINARAIANALEVSQPAVSKSLPLLKKLNLITMEKDIDSGRYSIEINRENKYALGLKRADNLKQLYEIGFIQWIWDNFPGSTVILFGSYSNGQDIFNSDIDIAIINSEKKELKGDFEKVLERPIIINYYKSFEKIDKHLLNNILNGIVLKGSIEL